MVGHNLDLFVDPVSDELICCICQDVQRDPAEFSDCQHSFCRACITESIGLRAECPKCRSARRVTDLRDASRAIRNIINELKMRCVFHENGCEQIITVEQIDGHTRACLFNFHACEQGCGARLTPASGNHSCIRFLGERNEKLEKELKTLKTKSKLQEERILELEETNQKGSKFSDDEISARVLSIVESMKTVNIPSLAVSQKVISSVNGRTSRLGPIMAPNMSPQRVRLLSGPTSTYTPSDLPVGCDKILIAGGMYTTINDKGHSKKHSLRSVHLYDPKLNLWEHCLDKPMLKARSQHTAVVFSHMKSGSSRGGSSKVIFQIGGFDFKRNDTSVESSALTNGILDGWLDIVPKMQVGRASACSAVLEGRIYVVGGLRSQNEHLSSVECYNPAKGQWIFRDSMRYQRSSFGLAYLDGSLYAVGGAGLNDQPLATGERFNAKHNKWSDISIMNIPRKSLALVAVPASGAGGKSGSLYAIGGYMGHVRKEVECYDPATDRWVQRAPLPVGVMDASAVRVGHYIWLFGGFDGAAITDRVWRYDTKQDSWSEAAPLPERKSFSTAVLI